MNKKDIIREFEEHVSSGKVDFFRKYGMDFVMGRREGPFLWDVDGGKRLINLHCNGGVFNLGHRHPDLTGVLKQAIDDADIGNHHLMSRYRAELAAKLAATCPGDLDYVVFGVGGGEAVDLALKVARGYTGRKKIVSAQGGYHGHTGLALAAGDPKYREPFGISLEGFSQVPFGDADALNRRVDEQTAAVILETVPATLGMPVPSREYMQEVARICREKGALLIMDEVQTGLGRTGKFWGFEHYELTPDIVITGKGLSGGLYPITATILRKDLESVFHDDPFIHISTFGGAEPGCAVALKVLEISSGEAFLDHVRLLADIFKKDVEVLRRKHPAFVRGLRQLGLMMGLELADELSGPLLTKTAYDQGLLMVYANNDSSVCQLLPPLNLDPSLTDEIMTRLDRAITSAKKLKPLLRLKRGFQKWMNHAGSQS